MKRLSLVLVTALLALTAQASHFSGGEIRYEFNGTNYDVYLYLYKICEAQAGAPLTNSASIQYSSASQSQSGNLNMTFLGFDTTHLNCGTSPSLCQSTTSVLPGYITASFKGTLTLPSAANDWVLSYNSCCRILGIVNLANSNSMYLTTTIDNSSAINSNPLLASSPSYYMSVGNTTVIPLQAIDPEGDNIVYDLVAPKETLTGPATYSAGYSATAPFGTGGTASINTTNNTLSLSSPSVGSYALALRMREYRNSVLVGEHFREFTVVVLPGSGSQTIPAPSTTTGFTYYTCPGQSNSLTLNFTDPTTTDSVYLTVTPPTISGWTFSSTVSNGSPSASATITWTTPSGLNPATLPFFYINVRARDNGCPRAMADYAVVVRTRQCNADSVWPGDANGDFTVNIYDPLAIAIAAGQTGPTRAGANTTWTAQACTNWTGIFTTNNVNMKHADCDGNGVVNTTDLGAVTANYSLSHPKGGRSKVTGTTDLYLDMTGVKIAPGKSVSIPVMLGTAAQPLANVYGLAARMNISGFTPATAPAFVNNTSWLAQGATAVNYQHNINTSSVDWALARTDQQNVSGNGVIGTLNFTVPADAVTGNTMTITLADVVIIDALGMERYDINTPDAVAVITNAIAVADIVAGLEQVTVIPNPSAQSATVAMQLNGSHTVHVRVADVTGRVIWADTHTDMTGNQQVTLPAAQLNSGIYFVQVSLDDAPVTRSVKWMKL